jgi:hypothetical protein
LGNSTKGGEKLEEQCVNVLELERRAAFEEVRIVRTQKVGEQQKSLLASMEQKEDKLMQLHPRVDLTEYLHICLKEFGCISLDNSLGIEKGQI